MVSLAGQPMQGLVSPQTGTETKVASIQVRIDESQKKNSHSQLSS
jgi:hypothetical protein